MILGDAAHAVSANVGAGCTNALQDSEILARAFIAADGDVVDAGRRFSAARLEDAHILTNTSKRVDDAINFKFHKNLRAWIAALPYTFARDARTWAILPGTPPLTNIPSWSACSR